ncbi:hypothetical protein OPQ81_007961 [Rhizoctonia solani]|nr:hypothetical protein OPQ81_007961 [Rhizoctonia solani]
MDAQGHPCPSGSSTDYYAPPHVGYSAPLDALPPLPNIPYPPSSVQGAGWFEHPRYFVNKGGDGTQQVFCWSLSLYNGSVIHYLWRVYQRHQFVLVEYHEHHGPTPFGAGGYVFDSISPHNRALWAPFKSTSPFVSPRAPVVLHPQPQPEWFGSNHSAPASNPGTLAQVPSNPLSKVIDNFSEGILDLYVDPGDMFLNPMSTPSTHYSDASSDVSAATDESILDASEAEETTRDPSQSFSVDEDGSIMLLVPDSLKTRKAVKRFISGALGELAKGGRNVKCSLCKLKKRNPNKLWDVKPSNLERHILAHLGIKDYECPICPTKFTTKDQMKKHIDKNHKGGQANTLDGKNREATNGCADQDIYAASFPDEAGLPVEAGAFELDQSEQALHPRYMEQFDDNYDFKLGSVVN